jgi:RNA polymerase sigma factor (sigma-70 family)
MTSEEFKDNVVSLSTRIFPMAARMLGGDEDAQDAVQEIMIKLWKCKKQLKEHPNLNGFVFLTARNHCLDRLKKKNPEQPDLIYQEKIPQGYHDRFEYAELYSFIQEIIKELPDNQKKVMVLYDIDGLEFEEIAAIVGLKIEHVRVVLSRARKFIREKLTKIYSYEQGTGG